MASIRFSALVSDVKGSVGGNVFQSNANGAFVRTKSTPVNRNTEAQQNQRLIMSVYAQKWQGLTDEDRQAWKDAAPLQPYINRLGEQKIYTGYQLFMKTNLVLESATARG